MLMAVKHHGRAIGGASVGVKQECDLSSNLQF